MSYARELERPYSLATLPQPIDRAHGRILAAEVSSLSGSRKRKRSEAVVTTDGDSISIYSVQNPQRLSSYAVPPQAYFTTRPCSAYRRSTKTRSARRFTYVSTSESPKRDHPVQLQCFDEELQPATLGSVQQHKFDIPRDRAALSKVEVLSHRRTQDSVDLFEHDVLVFYENGTLDCLASDLSKVLWTAQLNKLYADGNSDRKITFGTAKYILITTGAAVRKGLLKDREDIAAILGAGRDNEQDLLRATPVICVITKDTNESGESKITYHLHLFSLRPTSEARLSAHRPDVQYLISWELPAPHVEHEVEPSFHVQVERAIIQSLRSDGLVSYELRGLRVQETTRLNPTGEAPSSFLKLTSSLALACSTSFCGLFDLKYNSLQAFMVQQKELSDGDKKRKRAAGEVDLSTLKLLFYSEELEVAVGLTRNELVAFSLNSALPTRKGKRSEGLLLDAIGKGVRSKSTAYCTSHVKAREISSRLRAITATDTPPAELRQKLEMLEKLASKSDTAAFEAVFAEAVGIKLIESKQAIDGPRYTNGRTTNGTHTSDDEMQSDGANADVPAWSYPEDFWKEERYLHRPLALFALSKMFRWSSHQNGSTSKRLAPAAIEIAFMPPNVFNYLLVTECLSRDLIERALQQYGDGEQGNTRVGQGDVIAAIFNFDPQLRLLHTVLNSDAYLDVQEVTQAVRLLVQRLDTKSLPLPQLASQLLTNGNDAESNAELDYAVDDMVALIDNAQSLLEHGVLVLTQCLQPALTKLHSFPASRITATLRQMLTHPEMIFLIQLLRLQLRDGGWISRYFIDASDVEDGLNDEEPFDHAILIFANVLSCVLDAIGTGGWLFVAQQVPTTSEDAPDDLLHGLRQEVSAALEGIHEATFMKGLLAEFLRFGERTQKARPLPSRQALQAKGKPIPASAPGDVVMAEDRVLPLGLKPKEKIDSMRKQGGRMTLKTPRRMGLEISQQVPKYSVESIVF